ncbi:MAG: DNA replication/repair protein RecF [Armatimonadota bacterium]
MRVVRLRLANFRNYQYQDITFQAEANLLLGANGQGKTNLLEALNVLATTKSQRTTRDEELIGWNAEQALLMADVQRERRADVRIEMLLSRTEGKTVRLNSVVRPRVLEIIGELNVVPIWIEDLEIVRGDPAVRRRFLNVEISQVSPEYCFLLARYRRVLEHRNRLLKQLSHRGSSDEALSVWTEELVKYGAPILNHRREFITELAAAAAVAHAELTSGLETLELIYKPSFEAQEDLEQGFRRALEELLTDEIRKGMTLVGPHRDDFVFLINGHDARTYASLGQQRTVVLSLRLSELVAVERQIGEAPVLLVDDVFAELDSARARRLLEQALPGRQSFLVTTEAERLPADIAARCAKYRVSSGVLESVQ